ncbi:melanopsin-like, partial [Pollicipes pollicipes]|uniref:melanopsin-like n=1 Tax=Pollicipes pollicipes TaxID=41117 RepID=UPI001884FAC9
MTMLNLTPYSLPPDGQWVMTTDIPDWAHLVMGAYLAVVGTAGVVGNFLVLYIFLRYLRLRSQETTFITNMAASDFLCSVLHFMAVYSSFQHRWSFHRLGCELYAAGVGLCGLVSILTLACISLERCLVIRRGRDRWSLSGPLSRRKSRRFCIGIWVYCTLLVLPPFFGWSSYIPEGFLTSCSWDYFSRSVSNRTYFLLLFTMGFIIPLIVIIIAYSSIIRQVSRHEREMAEVMHSLPECVRGGVSSVSLIFTAAWLPYAAVTLVGQFGSVGTLSQWVTALPAVFAKGSVVFNPIVYGIAHKHFRMTVRRLIQRNASSDGSSHRPARFNSVERRQVSTWRTSTSSHVTKTRIRRLKFQRHLLTWHESSGGIASSASVRRVSTGIDLQRRQS